MKMVDLCANFFKVKQVHQKLQLLMPSNQVFVCLFVCFTCHGKYADPYVEVPPSNHCHFTPVLGAFPLLTFGLSGRPNTRSQNHHVKHPDGQQPEPVSGHFYQ